MTPIILRSEVQREFAMNRLKVLNIGAELLEVVIRKHSPLKTNPQLRTVHMWFKEIAAETGHTPEDIKALMKAEFLGREVREVMGKAVETTPSLADLKKQEMTDFMTRVLAFANEFGVVLTHPDDAPGQMAAVR